MTYNGLLINLHIDHKGEYARTYYTFLYRFVGFYVVFHAFLQKFLFAWLFTCCFKVSVVVRTSGFVRNVSTKSEHAFADENVQNSFGT